MSGCADLADTRVELALGLLSGTDRASAVSHLATCRKCREEVDDLSRVVDQLSLLAPHAEPPSGFETRVLAAVADGRVGRGRVGRGRRPPYAFRAGRPIGGRAAAVVAVGLIALGLILGFAADRTGDHPPADEANVVPPVRTALAVSPTGRTTCRVVVTGTSPATVLVSLDASPGASGAYAVAMLQVGGPTIDLGTLQMTDGHGVLARSVPVDAARLTTMLMYGEDGKLLYEAPLSDQIVTFQPRPGVGS